MNIKRFAAASLATAALAAGVFSITPQSTPLAAAPGYVVDTYGMMVHNQGCIFTTSGPNVDYMTQTTSDLKTCADGGYTPCPFCMTPAVN